jgi:AP2 domain/HNH endonuclease
MIWKLEFLYGEKRNDVSKQWNTKYAGKIAGNINLGGYLVIRIDKKPHYGQILAWFYVTGMWSKGEIDHKNEIKNDNRWNNFRLATRPQNMSNRGKNKNNTSGYKGVSWHKQRQKWSVRIGVNGKNIYLGLRNTKEDAFQLYCQAAKKYHGEFVNFGVESNG